ncbi:MAG: FAD-binding protein [Gemmatimonadota bacterium]
MIRRNGAQAWDNVHVTFRAQLDDLIDVDNGPPAGGTQQRGFPLLRQVAADLDGLAAEARQRGKRIRALGSGWALTDIALTDGWLINTKPLTGCFELSERYFEDSFEQARRPFVVLAQAGISVGQLNTHLELGATAGFPRALRTAGIGAGQTIAGAVSGNTHGSAINFGAMPDFVVGIQLVTGSGRSLWLERASEPVLTDEFVAKLGAERMRDDDVFDAAVVSFGAFGIITALAIETEPLYQLAFAPVHDISHADLKHKLSHLAYDDPPGLHHYEFVFDPYSSNEMAMEAVATKVPVEPGHTPPEPVWIVRSEKGFALGPHTPGVILDLPLVTPAQKTAFQFKQYRERCILDDTRGTPGQLFTATITYLEGYTESALGVSVHDAATMIDVSARVIRDMDLPAMAQVRVAHPSRALLGFTYLAPKTAVFEFGLAHDDRFPEFEDNLTAALTAEGVRYTFHWSKNSGLTPARLQAMYGNSRVQRWRDARKRVFHDDAALMEVFSNEHLERAGLA